MVGEVGVMIVVFGVFSIVVIEGVVRIVVFGVVFIVVIGVVLIIVFLSPLSSPSPTFDVLS